MRTRVLFVGGLLLALLAATLTGAAAARTNATNAKATPKAIDLATYPAKRWIVMLDKKPLARYSAREARADSSPAGTRPSSTSPRPSTAPIFAGSPATSRRSGPGWRRVVKGFRVERSFSADAERPRGPDDRDAGRQGPPHEGRPRRRAGRPVPPERCTRRRRRSARPRCGSRSEGRRTPAAAIKVAVIDSGIYVTKDAAGNYAGNPCFNDAGLHDAAGLPEGRHALHEQQGHRRRGRTSARAIPADGGQRHADPGPGRQPARHAYRRHGGV